MAKIGIVSRASFIQDGRGTFFHNGDGPYIDELASHFDELKLVTTVLRKGYHAAYNNWPKFTYQFTAPNVQVVEIPFTRVANPGILRTVFGWFRSMPSLWQAISASDFVGIFMVGMRSVIAWLFCLLLRKPYWVYIGSDWAGVAPNSFRWSGWRRRFLIGAYIKIAGALERAIARKAAFRLVTGTALLQKHAYPDSATYITHPLTSLNIESIPGREEKQIGATIQLLAVGNLNVRKGYPYLIQSLPLIRDRGIDLKLTIVGEGLLRPELERLLEELNLRPFVDLVGYVPNGPVLWKYYVSADIFVLSSLNEGLPRVILEAMAHGLPVICTDVSGLSQHFADREQVFFVPAKDPEAIAEAIVTLVQDANLRHTLVQNGLAAAREMMSNSAASQTADLIQKHILNLQ